MATEKFITVPQLAKLLGVSRIAVYKRVKKGQIPATKVGGVYLITDETVVEILGKGVTDRKKEQISIAVDRTMREYGDVIKRLGKQ